MNHLYWAASSSANAENYGALVADMWCSVANHLRNIHSGHNSKLFPKFVHDRITKRKKWLK